MQVPISRTWFPPGLANSVLEVLSSGWVVQGPRVREFEELWKDFTGAQHAIAVTSCTSGLEIGLRALGIGPGSRVLVPSFTWVSTASAAETLGAEVEFADIELETFNLAKAELHRLGSRKFDAVIPVHLFGMPCDIAAVEEFADSHGSAVVEDAACGFGGRVGDRHIGADSQLASFSFHPRKAITTGEGGMVTTNDEDLAEVLRQLRDHGSSQSDLQRHLGPKPYLLADHKIAGHNSRMTDIQGAMGVVQMEFAEEIAKERYQIASRYLDELADLTWLGLPHTYEGISHGFQSFVCIYEPDEIYTHLAEVSEEGIINVSNRRNTFMESLYTEGISTRPGTHAVHTLSYYKEKYKLSAMDYPSSFAAASSTISLPLFKGMTWEEQKFVIEKLRAR